MLSDNLPNPNKMAWNIKSTKHITAKHIYIYIYSESKKNYFHTCGIFRGKIKILRFLFTTFSRAMAPVVKQSAEQPVEVPERNDTETGSPQFSIFNRVTEASSAIGNVKVIVFLKISQSMLYVQYGEQGHILKCFVYLFIMIFRRHICIFPSDKFSTNQPVLLKCMIKTEYCFYIL